MYKVTIPLKLPSLNDYIEACNSNKYRGNKLKRETQDQIMWFLKRMPKYNCKMIIHLTWHEANYKRDKDNVCFAKKFILDALQELGKIPNDNNKYIEGFRDNFIYDGKYAVDLEIEEVKNVR